MSIIDEDENSFIDNLHDQYSPSTDSHIDKEMAEISELEAAKKKKREEEEKNK